MLGLFAFVIGTASVLAAAPKPQVSLRICIETEKGGSPDQAFPVRLTDPDQLIYVSAIPEATEHDLIGVEASGKDGVLLHFNHHAGINLNTDTLQHEGKVLVVILDGRLVYGAVIDMALPGSDFLVPKGVLPQEIALLQAVAKQNLKEQKGE